MKKPPQRGGFCFIIQYDKSEVEEPELVILSGEKYPGGMFFVVEPPLRVVPSAEGRISKNKDSAYLRWRSRLTAPSHGSGSTSQIIHRIICYAQDDA